MSLLFNGTSTRRAMAVMAMLMCSVFAHAQNGSIAGVITDGSSGETLIGVNVKVDGLDAGAATGLDGDFVISGLAPGTYALEVSYVSYVAKRIEGVAVKAGETTTLNFNLDQAVIELDPKVVVRAERIDNTANAILSMQKQAIGVQDGISSQEMSRYGANDAAGSLSKVTGVSAVDGRYIVVRGLGDRYSTAQLNGQTMASTDPYRNASQMDMIPSNLLDNIVASKTFTPDLPGSFTGGNVNIKTKGIPEAFTLSINASTTYNTQASLQDGFLGLERGRWDWLGYDDGRRAILPELADPATRALLTRSLAIQAATDPEAAALINATANGVQRTMAPVQRKSPTDQRFSFSLGNRSKLFGKNLGYLVGMNYARTYSHYTDGLRGGWELNEAGAAGLNKIFLFDDQRSTENPQVGALASLTYQLSAGHEVGVSGIYNHDTELLGRIQSGSYPGVLSNSAAIFETRTLSFREREMANAQVTGKHRFSAWNGTMLEWSGGYTQSRQEEPDLRFFANSVVDGDRFSINAAEYDLPYHFWRDLVDEQWQGKLDITIPFASQASKSNKLKFGGFYSDKTRAFSETRFQFQERSGMPYAGDPDAYFGEGNTGVIGTNPDTDRNTIGLYLVDDTELGNDYNGTERIMAIYGMGTYVLAKKLKITMGARAEQTDLSAISRDTSVAPGSINTIDFLPSLNLAYALNDAMNLRASVTRTLARPNMREIAPFVSFDQIGGELVRGNQDLQRSLITNYDLRWEWYPNPGEILAISGYFKDFELPIQQVYVPSAANPERTWQNVSDGQVAGIELEVRKSLQAISPSLRNLSIALNGSLIWSRVDIDEEEYAQNVAINPELKPYRPFQGQSPYLVNASLLYTSDSLGLEAALSFNAFGERLAAVSLQGTPDIYEQARPSLDLRLKKRLADRFAVTITARNLLDPTYQTSMRYQDEDYVVSEFRLGRRFGLGFSYTIR